MDNDIHITHRQETFNDFAVRELAMSRARCMCLLQYKRCKKGQCNTCSSGKRLQSCMNCMNDYDRERLDNYTLSYYEQYSMNPMSWMGHKQFVRSYNWFVGIFLIIMLVIIGCVALLDGPFSRPQPQLDYDSMIVSVIQVTQDGVYDLDKDGLVNCIDYSILFKLTWDRMYPLLKNKCQIIRNVNRRTGMNHLFIQIWDDNNNAIYVEPWAPNPYVYDMRSNWGDRYDPTYNKYGETDYWISEAK